MIPNLSLFGKTKKLEHQIDSFFDKLSEASVVFRLGVRLYLKEGYTEEFNTRLERVVELERQLYSNTLIPDSRGDVLGLIETVDQLLSEFEDTLLAFSIEKPIIPDELTAGYRKLTNMVVKAVDELALSGRAFFRSPHDVPAYNHKVILYEKEADKISTNLKIALFESDLELVSKLHLREFVDRIDGVADLAEDVADRLTIYAIKRLT